MTWDDFLAEYEMTIDSTMIALDQGKNFDPKVLQPFAVPTGLGPLPADLHERTAKLIRKNALLQTRLNDTLDEIGQELGAVRREGVAVASYAPTARAAVSKYFDKPA